MKRAHVLRVFVSLCALVCTSCGASRPPVPPGVIPEPSIVSAEDERYGHEVLNLLTDQYPIDHDDARINRVRRIVDTLTAPFQNQADPWNVYVLRDDSVKNAAATRGNYVFVWSGMVNEVKTDGELAAILAHEIGHVLAKHTEQSPKEEVSSIISGVAGQVAHEIVSMQGQWGILAGLAQSIIEESINAMIINPELQEKELEADRIGLLIMADAGYDPQEALGFWERVKDSPDFSNFPVQFLSSHPSSEERIQGIRETMPLAVERYQGRKNPSSLRAKSEAANTSKESAHSKKSTGSTSSGSGSEWDWGDAHGKDPSDTFSSGRLVTAPPRGVDIYERGESVWQVVSEQVAVFNEPSPTATRIQTLVKGTHVTVVAEVQQRNPSRRWVKIINPVTGFSESRNLAPVTP